MVRQVFFLKHRNRQRGVGGIFFDDFAELGFEQSLAMTQAVGDAFTGAYLHPIRGATPTHPYGDRERDFQLYRRGRYVEIQPRLGPRHPFWPTVRRAHRVHFAVYAASSGLGLPAPRRARQPPAELTQRYLVRRDWL